MDVRSVTAEAHTLDQPASSAGDARRAEAAPRLECAAGDALGWRELHRHFQPVAVAFLRKMGVREGDLDDACQDVFVEMFRYLPRFRGDADPKTWLYRLCITQARRTRARHRIRDTLERLLARAPEAWPQSSPSFCERAARRRIDAALARLSESDRTVFVLFEMEGLPGEQVAEIVGCTTATLWRRLHHARERFRAALVGSEEAA
jgi:RNA polymerase sigma-70 factor (ECF subfamily)